MIICADQILLPLGMTCVGRKCLVWLGYWATPGFSPLCYASCHHPCWGQTSFFYFVLRSFSSQDKSCYGGGSALGISPREHPCAWTPRHHASGRLQDSYGSSNMWLTYTSLLPFYRSCLFFIMSELCSPFSSSNTALLEEPHVERPHPAPCHGMTELRSFLCKQAAAWDWSLLLVNNQQGQKEVIERDLAVKTDSKLL